MDPISSWEAEAMSLLAYYREIGQDEKKQQVVFIQFYF